jgi:hypothetical protein
MVANNKEATAQKVSSGQVEVIIHLESITVNTMTWLHVYYGTCVIHYHGNVPFVIIIISSVPHL